MYGHTSDHYNGIYYQYDYYINLNPAFSNCQGMWLYYYPPEQSWNFHDAFPGDGSENLWAGGRVRSPNSIYDYSSQLNGLVLIEEAPPHYKNIMVSLEKGEVDDDYDCA